MGCVPPSQRHAIFALLVFSLGVAAAYAKPQPGDVFKEFWWDSSKVRCSETYDWCGIYTIRVGGAMDYGGHNLPVTVDDLDGAVKAEIEIPKLKSHGGVLEYQLNDNGTWVEVPTPGTAAGYEHMVYPVLPLSLSDIKEGVNHVKFRNTGTGGWPQIFVYGLMIRVYYEATKSHPAATLAAPAAGSTVGVAPEFSLNITEGAETVDRAEYIGLYEDYNWEGDGAYRQWHYHWFYSVGIMHHVATGTDGPAFAATWDNLWLPDQPEPMTFCARVVAKDGTIYMTPAVDNVTLSRSYHVEMCKPSNVPHFWVTRSGQKGCDFDVQSSVGLDQADSARVYVATWGPGYQKEKILINGKEVSFFGHGPSYAYITWDPGFYHPVSFDIVHDFSVPATNALKTGKNRLEITRGSGHGIEVLWPGPAVLIRYQFDPSTVGTRETGKPSQSLGRSLAPVAAISDDGILRVRFATRDDYRLSMWSTDGRRVLTEETGNTARYSVPVGHLAPGAYLLRTDRQDGASSTTWIRRQ